MFRGLCQGQARPPVVKYFFFFFRDGCVGVEPVHRSYIGRGLEETCGMIQRVSWPCA